MITQNTAFFSPPQKTPEITIHAVPSGAPPLPVQPAHLAQPKTRSLSLAKSPGSWMGFLWQGVDLHIGPGLQGYPQSFPILLMEEIPNNHLRSTKTLWTMGYPPLSAGAGFRPSTVWKLVTLEPCRHVQLRDGFSQRNGGRMTYGFFTMKLMNPKMQLKCQVHFLWAFTDSYGWVSTPILRCLKSLIKLQAWKTSWFWMLSSW